MERMMSETAKQIVKRVDNAVLWSDGSIRVENCVMVFQHVDEPSVSKAKNDDGKPPRPKYSAYVMLPKRTHRAAKDLVREQIEQVLKEKNRGEPIKKSKWFLRNGDDEGKAYAVGHFIVTASNNADSPPSLRYKNQKGGMDRTKAPTVFYPGAIVDIIISPWWWTTPEKQVNANLLAVRCVDDTTPRLAGIGRGMTEEDIDNSFELGGDGGDWDDGEEV
jgi:Protein of unknown function (DUF2815)